MNETIYYVNSAITQEGRLSTIGDLYTNCHKTRYRVQLEKYTKDLSNRTYVLQKIHISCLNVNIRLEDIHPVNNFIMISILQLCSFQAYGT